MSTPVMTVWLEPGEAVVFSMFNEAPQTNCKGAFCCFSVCKCCA